MTAIAERETLARLQHALAGRYAIVRELGRGGMAIVYLARDLKHGRDVAIKLLRPELAALVGAERFLREIRLTAALQHPHILPLHDSGEADGLLYYVMPRVTGESLRERLTRERQLPVGETVTLIGALAGALDHAHRHGVVHRDIKPENVLLHEGQPLLADFGVALALSGGGDDRLTGTGLSVGTPQYMSPEQAAGDRAVGPPSDIYALGAVAYELLVGEPPITGPTPEAVLARVLVERPRAIRTVRDTVPAAVEAAILKALAKAPADRFRTAGEFAAALMASAPRATAATHRPRARAARLTLGATGVLAIGLMAFALIDRADDRPGAPPPIRRQLTFSGRAMQAAISPDGHFLAIVTDAESTQVLTIQEVAGGRADTVLVTPRISTLEWSPDNTRLLVWAEGGALIVPRLGGPVQRIAIPPGAYYVRWLPDGRRVSAHAHNDRRTLVLDLDTEDTLAVRIRGQYDLIGEIAWSPDGRWFAVATENTYPMRYLMRTVSLDGRSEVIAEDSVMLDAPRWSPDGDAVYYVRGRGATAAIWRAPVSRETGQPRGKPVELHSQLEGLSILGGIFHFSVTQDGRRMVYARGTRFSNLWMVPADRPGRALPPVALTTGTALRWSPVVSPDGKWIAFGQHAGGVGELFRMSIDGGKASQITYGARVATTGGVAWSPEGDRLAFTSVRGSRPQLWVASVVDGSVRSLDRAASGYMADLVWAPGSEIALQAPEDNNIALVDPVSGKERWLLADAPKVSGIWRPRYSPEGNRLAAIWFRPDRAGVLWIFDLRDSTRTKIADGEWWPSGWSADGRYVYAGALGADLFRVDTRGASPPTRVLTVSWRGADCTPVGPRRPDAFVCAAFDYVSDIWMIENFDQGTP